MDAGSDERKTGFFNVYLQGNVHYKTRMKVRLKQALQTGQTGKDTYKAMS